MPMDYSEVRMLSLLLVATEQSEALQLEELLAAAPGRRFDVTRTSGVDEALVLLQERPFDVVLLDLAAREDDALQLLTRARVAAADVPVVVIGREADEDLAIEALRTGAQEYLARSECTGRLVVRAVSQAVERHRIQEELRVVRQRDHFNATHDGLTGLSNREAFLDRLPALIAHAQRNGKGLALLFVDLDHFKSINDSLGHAAGDQLLKFVGERMSIATRRSDALARFAGDEFVVCVQDVAGPQDPAAVAQNLLQTLSDPYLIGRNEAWVTASIGIAVYPADGVEPLELLRNSDMAMYRAKMNGRNNFQFCTESMNASAARRSEIRTNLTRALGLEQLSLEYQPVRDLASGRVTAAEALLRWRDPGLGEVAADEFVSIAEDTGLIVPMGEWVLQEVCRQARAWRDEGFRTIRFSVNVAARQLRQHTLIGIVRDRLQESDLSPEQLELEITEGTLIESDSYTLKTLDDLSRMGVGLAIDDFGTGYSALSYLNRFSFDRLKLDRSFLQHMSECPEASRIVEAILTMAVGLRLRSVAEGVETEEQVAFLAANGCHEIQGYLVGQPVPAAEFTRYLEREKSSD